MRIARILKILLIVVFVVTLTACSKTKPDNNLERLWHSLIAQHENSPEHALAIYDADAAPIPGHG